MPEQWTHIRIRRSTYERLADMIAARDKSAAEQRMVRWWKGDEGPSMDELVVWLIQHVKNDRRRSREARRRRTIRRATERLEARYDLAEGQC